MRRLILLICLTAAVNALADVSHNLVEIRINSKTTITDIQTLGMDIADIDYQTGVLHLVTTPRDEATLLANGFSYTIAIENMEDFFASRLNAGEPMGGYHTYDEAVEEINQLHIDFPDIVGEPYSIGQSLEGREIWMVKISDNPEIDEDEPEIFYNALIHAREPITVEILLYFIHYLTDNYPADPEVAYLVENREMFFCPVVNPDGYMHNEETNPGGGGMWRKNMRDNNNSGAFEEDYDGVDLNRNFGYMWGYNNQGSSPNMGSATYRGAAPFSEPEIAAIRDFVDSRHFTITLNYHSYSNLYTHSWGYDYIYTEDHDLLSELGWEMSQYNGYIVGPSWMNLYTVNGGANDWMYGDTSHAKIICYVPEVGNYDDNFWPPEYRIIPLCEENLGPNLLVAQYADDPWRALPPAIPTVTPIDTVAGEFTISWNPNTDPSNPPAGFDIAELRGWEVVTNDLESAAGVAGWEIYGFILSTARCHSPNLSYFSNAVNNSQTSLRTIELCQVNPGDTLRFWTWYDIEDDYDYGYLMVSRDFGYAFEPIEGNITTNYNPNDKNIGNGITGSSDEWVEAVFDLSDYTGESILFSFVYITDWSVLGEGWYVDDIYPFVQYESETILVESHPDTFLQVDPGSEPGFVYYRVRAFDGEADYSMWSIPEEVYCLGAGVSLRSEGIPDTFALNSIYPNPFNSSAVINFQIAKEADTQIRAFNIAGQTVQESDLGVLQPGEYDYMFNGERLAGGIYFLRLISGENTAVRKIVLLK